MSAILQPGQISCSQRAPTYILFLELNKRSLQLPSSTQPQNMQRAQMAILMQLPNHDHTALPPPLLRKRSPRDQSTINAARSGTTALRNRFAHEHALFVGMERSNGVPPSNDLHDQRACLLSWLLSVDKRHGT